MNPGIHEESWPRYAHDVAQGIARDGALSNRNADPISLAMHATAMANIAVHAIHALAKILQSEHVSKSLDVEAYDAMGELAERLDRMETTLSEVADSGFRYRGHWRQGMSAKRGDAFTEGGSLWWAIRSTDEKPCNESPDWQIAVRKGRDAQ
jgi:hypothetical protein